MSVISPAILAKNPHQYREQLERIEDFALRVQIDLVDGEFADDKTIRPEQIYYPDSMLVDFHLMYKKPEPQLSTLVSYDPNLIIIHAESDGDKLLLLENIKSMGIKSGLAILAESQVKDYKNAIQKADHVMIFSGDLGHYGGQADLALLDKVDQIRQLKPEIEIGWDGGINDENVAALANGGIDVLNVGGYIQKSEDPKSAYDILDSIIQQ